jgi:hypothetical protein
VEPLNIDPPAPETFEDEESETESNSDKVEPSTPPEDNNNDKTKTSRLDSKENSKIMD